MRAARPAVAEFLGTAVLLAVVVGSGIMAERLSPSNAGVALLANALATGFALYILITVLSPVSGAHFNPIVTVASWLNGGMRRRDAIVHMAAQWSGAVAGVWLAHLMFELPLLQESRHARAGLGQWLSEVVATSGLLVTIAGFLRHAPSQTPAAVGAYIAAAYWFTASTSFANPAVTTARAFTDTFAGIAPANVPLFLSAQVVALVLARALNRYFFD